MSKSFNLTIRLGNEAMRTGRDVAEALRKVAAKVEGLDERIDFDGPATIMDLNGASVGSWSVQGADDLGSRS